MFMQNGSPKTCRYVWGYIIIDKILKFYKPLNTGIAFFALFITLYLFIFMILLLK